MPLPNFLIIGAAKAGTTSLYHYLRQHPDVYMSPVKEPQYFCEERPEMDGAIRTRQAYERLFERATSQRAVGEASPQYLNSVTAPRRIAADLPDVKLIASLRNPADRAYSSYLGRLRSARERCGVEEAMRPGTYYFETSLYYAGLSRYFEQFDRNRIRILLFDELAANPRAVVRTLHEFLQVDDTVAPDVSILHNTAAVPRSLVMNEIFLKAVRVLRHLLPPAMRDSGLAGRAQGFLLRQPGPLPPVIRRRLLQQFSDDIARTGALIGRDLSHWLSEFDEQAR